MLTRACLFLAVPACAALALSSVACSSLTKPDEIQIFAEPPPAPKPAVRPMAPAAPAPPGAARAAAPAAAAAAAPGCGN